MKGYDPSTANLPDLPNQKHQSIVKDKDPSLQNKHYSRKFDDQGSIRSLQSPLGQKVVTGSIHSSNDERIDHINSKLGYDKDYSWFKVSQGLFTTLWLGISRTNVTILNKDKTEEIGNYPRSNFTVLSSSSNSIKCQADEKTLSFSTADAKKIAFLLTPLMMWQVDNDGNLLNANQLFLDFLGANVGDKLNIFDPAVINPSDYQACCSAFAKGKTNRSPFSTTRGLKCHDGKYYTYTAKAIPEFDSDGNVSSWYGTCFAEHVTGKDFQKKAEDNASIQSFPRAGSKQKIQISNEQSTEEEKIDLINSKLGFDKDYTWFKVGQGLFTTLWLGISRTNVAILNKDKSEEIGNYPRSNFTVLSSSSNSLKCQADEKTLSFSTPDAKKIAFLLTPLMMWQVDNEGNVLTANQLFLDFLGAKADDKLNIFDPAVVNPSDYQACCSAFAKGKASKSPFTTTRGLKCHDGKYYTYTAKAIPEFDSDGSVSSWYGTCFAEHATGKDFQKKAEDQKSFQKSSGQKLPMSVEESAEEAKIDLINSKLGFDKDYTWFKVGQGMFTTQWLGISRTNVAILNKEKTEEIGNYARSNFTVLSSSSNSIKCQGDEKTFTFSTADAKKIAFMLTPLMMWQVDNDGNVLTANQLFLDFLGAKADDKLNIFDPAVVNPSDYQACCSAFAKGKANKSPFTTTRGLKCCDGKFYTYTAKAIPEFDSDGGVTSWYGTCFAEQAMNKDFQRKSDENSSLHSVPKSAGIKLPMSVEESAEEEKIDQINSKLGFDKDYSWFKVSQGLFTTLWLGISRTNVTILNKDKSEEIGNYARSNFSVLYSTSISLKCQADDKTLTFNTSDAKKIAFLLTPLMMWQVDNDGNVLTANQLFLDFLGAKADDKLNIFDPAVVNPSDYKACYATFAQAKKEKYPFSTTRGLKCHDGKYYTYTAKAIPEFDSDGNISSWYGTCFAEHATNIQKKVNDQESLHSVRKSNSTQKIPMKIEESTEEDKIDHINSKLGFDKDYSWFKVGQGLFTTLWLGISRTNVTVLNKDRTEEIGNYMRSNFSVISSTSNSLKCQADDKILNFNTADAKKIAFLLTPLMMWQVDNDGNVLNANQLFLDFLGATAEDKLNIFDPAVVNPSDYKACCAAFAKGKADKSPFSTTRGLRCHNGKYYTYTAKAIPEFDSDGNVSSWYGTCFAEQAVNKDILKKVDRVDRFDDRSSVRSGSSPAWPKANASSIHSSNDERVDHINSKLGFDKDYTWFKVTQGFNKTLWVGISRTNVTILNKDKTEEIGNFARSNFTVVNSTSNSLKCQAEDKTFNFSTADAKKIAFLLTPLMMWQIDNDGYVINANQLFLDFLGANADDKLNIFDPAVVNPSDYKACCAAFAKGKANRSPFAATRGLKCHDGKYYTYTAKAIPEFDSDGNVSSWYGTCFAEHITNKDFQKRTDDNASLHSLTSPMSNRITTTSKLSSNDEKIDHINSKLGFDKDYTWFKVSQGMFTTLWLGISRTNVTILNKDKTEEIANHPRSEFTVVSSTSNSLKCQAEEKTFNFSTSDAKKIAFLLTPLMMWQIDNDGNVLTANQLFLDFLGATVGDKLNIFDPAVVNPSDYKACCAAFAKGKADRAPFSTTRGLKCHNGKFYTYTAKAIPEFDSDGSVSSWYGTCFAEQAASKDIQRKIEDHGSSLHSPSPSSQHGLPAPSIHSSNDEKVDHINSKLGFDKDYTWFKVTQGFNKTLWVGISRTNVTILNKDRTEELGNYSRSNFTVVSSTANSLKCQADDKTWNLNSAEAKKIAFLLTPLMMWQIDNDGNVLNANQLFLDFLGARADDDLNIFDPAVVNPSDYQACCIAFEKGKVDRSPFSTTRGLKCHDGKYYTYTAKAVPEFDSDGNVSSWYGTCFAEQAVNREAQKLLPSVLKPGIFLRQNFFGVSPPTNDHGDGPWNDSQIASPVPQRKIEVSVNENIYKVHVMTVGRSTGDKEDTRRIKVFEHDTYRNDRNLPSICKKMADTPEVILSSLDSILKNPKTTRKIVDKVLTKGNAIKALVGAQQTLSHVLGSWLNPQMVDTTEAIEATSDIIYVLDFSPGMGTVARPLKPLSMGANRDEVKRAIVNQLPSVIESVWEHHEGSGFTFAVVVPLGRTATSYYC